MAALTGSRMTRETRLKNIALPLGIQSVFQGGIACIDVSAAVVKKGAAGNANLVRIGEFVDTIDNSGGSAGGVTVLVSLDREICVRWYDNDTGGNAVTSSDLFTDVYMLDDHTVTKASSGNSKAGRVWFVNSTNGVAVEATTGTVGL